ncbi:MAG: EpsD family peptidyl-prolyl cis-trans isomerase [Telluria sp.]|nr:EpsD family peptidyl-prolyl cis-trans isomerase [Telluria sp.]
MDNFDLAGAVKPPFIPSTRLAGTALLMLALAGAGCGNKEKKAGQSLASVNGEEITVLQLNEELQRSGVQAARQEAASKQLLEVLIDRQLLQNEAAKEKLDRDPKVVQAVERAKALIVAQAYMQKRIGNVPRPDKAEVEEYYRKNPQFFADRKQFDMKQLVLSTADLDAQVKPVADAAKSLDEVAAWMDQHKVKYARGQVLRTSADIPPELSSKLQGMPQGQLFVIKEGDRSMLISVADVKEAPVSLELAAPQIEQFLVNKKNKEAAEAELKRLRANAKIVYLNPPAAATPAQAVAGAPAAPAPVQPVAASSESNERGVAGLK